MKILPLLLGAVLASALLQGSAQASESVPQWAAKTASLNAAPTAIVDTAPRRAPLNVVITRRTANGPTFETVPARSEKSAEKIIDRAQDGSSTIAVTMTQPITMAAFKADPYRPSQWAHDVLRTSTAWESSVGNGVTVAVVDTGVLATHSDLADKVLSGYDFVDNDNNAADRNGHGTHVAGIIAAIAGNGIGIAGITRGTSILPVRVLDQDGNGDSAGLARGIVWAANNGANVINLSLASDATSDDPAVITAIDYARSMRVVVVAAAGNAPCPRPLSGRSIYPANHPGVIGVGAIDSNRSISSFSCAGPWTDVVAPGGGIISTMVGTPAADLGCPGGSATNNYCILSGTSMATPYVAGVAALAIAAIGPKWTVADIEGSVQNTTTDLGPIGRDPSYGNGLINPVAMLNLINNRFGSSKPPATPPITAPSSRLSGTNRYDTAVAISRETFAPGVDALYVATGSGFADGLVGGPAAARAGGPLLLLPPKTLPATVVSEIKRLRPRTIVVLGGSAVVSEPLVSELSMLAPVTRAAGSNRYDTAARVSEQWTTADTVYMATGLGFPDALSASALAAGKDAPLLLTTTGQIPAATTAALNRLKPSKIVIVGGTGVVSTAVENTLKARSGVTVSRIAGADRYETSAKALAASGALSSGKLMLAAGTNFPDALAGTPAANKIGAGFALTRTECVPLSLARVLAGKTLSNVYLLGGTSVIATSAPRTRCS